MAPELDADAPVEGGDRAAASGAHWYVIAMLYEKPAAISARPDSGTPRRGMTLRS
jgi:hypothetical protein